MTNAAWTAQAYIQDTAAFVPPWGIARVLPTVASASHRSGLEGSRMRSAPAPPVQGSRHQRIFKLLRDTPGSRCEEDPAQDADAFVFAPSRAEREDDSFAPAQVAPADVVRSLYADHI